MVWVLIYLLLHTSESLYRGRNSQFLWIHRDCSERLDIESCKTFLFVQKKRNILDQKLDGQGHYRPRNRAVMAFHWAKRLNILCKLRKCDRFCAYECLPVLMYKRLYNEMEVGGAAYGDNIILTLDVIIGGTLCWFSAVIALVNIQFWSLHHFHNSWNWDPKMPFPRLNDLIILLADVYCHIRWKLRYPAPSGQKGCWTSSFSGYWNVISDTWYKQPTRCNNNNFINNFNQLNMFRAIISPILRSTRLCLQLVV